jgi:hypothetical protein
MLRGTENDIGNLTILYFSVAMWLKQTTIFVVFFSIFVSSRAIFLDIQTHNISI